LDGFRCAQAFENLQALKGSPQLTARIFRFPEAIGAVSVQCGAFVVRLGLKRPD